MILSVEKDSQEEDLVFIDKTRNVNYMKVEEVG